MSVEVLVKQAASSIGEGPHWEESTASLLYVDIWKNDVHRWDSITKTDSKVHLEDSVSFVVPRYSSGYMVGCGRRLSYLNWNSQEVTHLAEVDQGTRNRFNDAKCDASGRLWAGTMGDEVEPARPELNRGSLYSLERNLTVRKHVSAISISNGLAWSHDTSTMFYIDTIPRQVYAFDFDINQGILSNRRTVFDFGEGTQCSLGHPDGMCIDQDEKLWIASFGVGKINHLDPRSGKIIGAIELPTRWPTSCCFGGTNYDELYITTSCTHLTPDVDYQSDSLAGSVFRVTQLGVKGMPAPVFQG